MKKFKIRCSAIGHIMASGLTEKQVITLNDLQSKEKRTDRQDVTLNDLIRKRDTLPEGAKTYCKDWLKGELFDYHKMLKNKYLDKGNIMEDESIDFIAENLGYGMLLKNEEYFKDEFMHGTPDILLNDLVIDVKNSWDCSTFPLFDDDIDSGYYWQLQGYMYLAEKSKAKLIYCLLDTPDHLIYNEARWHSISLGFEELEESIYEKFKKNMTYKDVPNKLKTKVYDIERNDEGIEKIKTRVIQCKDYIEQLNEKLK